MGFIESLKVEGRKKVRKDEIDLRTSIFQLPAPGSPLRAPRSKLRAPCSVHLAPPRLNNSTTQLPLMVAVWLTRGRFCRRSSCRLFLRSSGGRSLLIFALHFTAGIFRFR